MGNICGKCFRKKLTEEQSYRQFIGSIRVGRDPEHDNNYNEDQETSDELPTTPLLTRVVPSCSQTLLISSDNSLRSSAPFDPDMFKRKLQKTLKIKRMFHSRAMSGFLSKAAIASLLLKLDIEDSAIHEYMYRHCDKDDSGDINFFEFFKFMISISDIYKKFSLADSNDDYTVSFPEFQLFLDHFSVELENATVQRIVRIFDMDDNEVLSFGEFAVLYIFLIEVLQIHKEMQANKPIVSRRFRKLLNDQQKESAAVQRINQFGCPPQLTLDQFVSIIAELHEKFTHPTRPRARTASQWQKELKQLDSGLQWKDKNFDPDNTNLLPLNLAQGNKIKWLRPKEIRPDDKLFIDGVSDGDVIQGKLNDCWFLGALAVIAAKFPEKISDLFVAADSEKGYYRCQFYKGGEWTTVTIDDRLPCFETEKEHEPVLYFASCHHKSEFWVPILEKAYAKLHRSYDSLENGDICEAMKDLTGGATQTFFLDKWRNTVDIWNKMLAFEREGSLMGCAIIRPEIRGTKETSGLLENHAYSILKCQEVDGVRFVLLRNPWGKQEWTGPWSDMSPQWSATWKNKPFVENYAFDENDGRFHMSFEDFTDYFTRLYVLRLPLGLPRYVIKGEWVDNESAGGCKKNPYWYCNPRYKIKINEPDTTVLVNLSQPDLRKISTESVSTRKDNYEMIGLYLLEKNDYKTMECRWIEKESVFIDTRDTSLEHTFSTPSTYVLLPCTYDPDRGRPFVLSVFSNKENVEVEPIPAPKLQTKITGKWEEGFVSKSEIDPVDYGPRFSLKCNVYGNVDILLIPRVSSKQKTLSMGIKVTSFIRRGWVKEDSLEGRSACISFTANPDEEYIIEAQTFTKMLAEMKFEILVYSESTLQLIEHAKRRSSSSCDGSCNHHNLGQSS